MKKLSYQEITSRRLKPEDIHTTQRFPVFTLLDNIRSLYNVGAIFRTADAVRLGKLYLTGITGSPPRKEIDKTALGAVTTVPWEYRPDALPLFQELKRSGMPMVVLEHTSESQLYTEFQPTFPLCLVVGNEVFGVQDKLVELADAAIEIPMYGSKQSLNVTIAYGIVIYHLLFKYLENNQLRA
jgi:tRNA G18 (ribose-2'-O)-methylase SpoU